VGWAGGRLGGLRGKEGERPGGREEMGCGLIRVRVGFAVFYFYFKTVFFFF
jgi:hypothetical protein